MRFPFPRALTLILWTAPAIAGQSVLPLSEPGRSMPDWAAHATELEIRGDWQGLVEWSEEWIGTEPESSLAWFTLGAAHAGAEEYSDAVAAYIRSIRSTVDNPATWNNLGHAYLKQKRPDVASEALLEAVALLPDFDIAWFNLGLAYFEMELPDKAIEAYETAISIRPTYAYWRQLGIAYGHSELARWRAADFRGEMDNTREIDAYLEALRLQPEDTFVLHTLAVTYASSGNMSEAWELHARLNRLNPTEALLLSADIRQFAR